MDNNDHVDGDVNHDNDDDDDVDDDDDLILMNTSH